MPPLPAPFSDLDERLISESRSTTTLLLTRSLFLKEHLANLMHLICRYDAAMHEMAELAGEEGRRVRRSLDLAAREVDRDGLLKEMMELLERCANDAADLEELHAMGRHLDRENSIRWEPHAWIHSLAGELERSGQLHLVVEEGSAEIPPCRIPACVPELLASALRSLAIRCPAASEIRLSWTRAQEGPRFEADLRPASEPDTPGERAWIPTLEAEPAVVRVCADALDAFGGTLQVLRTSAMEETGPAQLRAFFPTNGALDWRFSDRHGLNETASQSGI